MREQITRMLAIINSTTYVKKVKLLGVASKLHTMNNKRADTIPPTILSCTPKGHPTHDVLKDVKSDGLPSIFGSVSRQLPYLKKLW
jgi:hypothetical protein